MDTYKEGFQVDLLKVPIGGVRVRDPTIYHCDVEQSTPERTNSHGALLLLIYF